MGSSPDHSPLRTLAAIAAAALALMPSGFAQEAPPEFEEPTAEPSAPADNPPALEPPDRTPPTDEEIRAAIEALDSDDFREREAASQIVWEYGRAAEEQLRKMVAEATTAEMRYRGGRILSEFELGVYPDTPEQVRELVRRYRRGDQGARATVVQQLADLGQTELLAKLVRGERDPRMRAIIADVLADGVERLAPMHIAKGDYDKALELLRVGALHPQGIKNYVAFLAGTGKLPEAIEQQRPIAGDSPVDTELFAWMLRMDGQFAEAAKVFEGAGDKVSARGSLAASGDPVAYAESNIDRSKADIGTLGFQLASARLRQDNTEIDRLRRAITEYARAIPDESIQCFTVLILNGYAPDAIGLARDLQDDDLAQIALARYDFEEAMRSLGTENVVGPYDAWLKGFGAKFRVEREQDIPRAIKPAVDLAEACIETGQTAEAERLLRETGRLLERTGDSQLHVVTAATQVGLWDLAIELAVKAMELETEFATVEALYGYGGNVSTLRAIVWEHLRDSKPDQSNESALRELGALLTYTGTTEEEVDPIPIIDAIRAAADEEADVDKKATVMLNAAELARIHSLGEVSIKHYADAFALLGAKLRPDHHSTYGIALFAAEKFEEAAEQFALASELDGSNALYVYLRGLARSRAGDEVAGDEFRKRAALMGMGNSFSLNQLSAYALENGDDALSTALDKAIVRLARADSPSEGRSFRLAQVRATERHLAAREFDRAAAAGEITNLSLMDAQYYSAAYALSRYMSQAKIEARAQLDAGEIDAAIETVRKAVATVPSDSSMLEDAYQLLADNGRGAEADEFFQAVYQPSKRAAETFTEHGQFHNNLAWLLSRCGKNLDEALAAATRALELEPDNGAFLDTMAEVHFQRGDREQAIEYSEKAVAVLGDDAQLLHQLERFRTGQPTDR